jgi:hypothetical protein
LIDVTKEKTFPLKQATVPNCTTQIDIKLWYRYASKGARGGVVLETIRVGGRLHTSNEAISRFVEATSTRRSTPAETAARQKACEALAQKRAKAKARSEAASKRLAAKGW